MHGGGPFRIFFWLILIGGLLPSGGAAERRFERTLPLAPGGRVILDTYRGSITVEEGETADVRLTAEIGIDAATPAEADQVFAAVQLAAEAAPGVVTITARNPRDSRARFIWHEKLQVDLAFRLTVPRGSTLDLRTINGAIAVGNFTGHVKARAENGAITFRRIDGSIDAATQFGDIIVSRCLGPVQARVLRGLIRTGTIGGPSTLKNTSGDIEVMMARGPLDGYAEAGDLIVGFPHTIAGAADLVTSGGNVRVSIDPLAACEVRASSRWGRVASKLPLAVTDGATGTRRLTGRLNAGGPTLSLRADGGQVRIDPGETLFEGS